MSGELLGLGRIVGSAQLADKTLPARLRRYANPDLLIDEAGFLVGKTPEAMAAV
jgi:hypothetical protein